MNATIKCRGCECDTPMERRDWYGITTGYWCDKCYDDSSKYPFRKDRYPTVEYDGYGERLGLDDDY